MTDVEKIIRDEPLWAGAEDVQYEPLNGGFSNYMYKVSAGGRQYALRINGGQNDFLGLDRAGEVQAIRKASQTGVAPPILTDENNTVYMITEFMRGEMLTNEQTRESPYIQELARVLKVIHAMDGLSRACTPFLLIEQYAAGMERLGVGFPDGLRGFLGKTKEIEARCARYAKYCGGYCHNDFYPFNIINDNGRLCVVDWELSGAGNVFFDLATPSFYAAYTPEQDAALLTAYFGCYEDEFGVLLHDMKYMNMLREVTWALMHSGLDVKHVNHDQDYRASAMRFLDRLERGLVTA